ncbi:hypothetical protein FQR65_LT11525 [Abscondita terminalis]|nr:hypothetical protein FQR65_LT11525 [Abscondita terminalis]
MSIDQILIPDYIETLIYKYFKECGINEKANIIVKPGVKPGDNWMGQILEINVKVDNREEISIIGKLAPTLQFFRDSFPVRSIYEREIYMYSTILPEFLRMQQENNVISTFAPFAKCYATHFEDKRETLLLENMKKYGYRTVRHEVSVDYHHASLVMKSCAKLHALSFVFRTQNPDLFENMISYLKKSTEIPESFCESVANLAKIVLNGIEENTQRYKALERFVKHPSYMIDLMLQLETVKEYEVINHGDYQIRNILFKYSDDSNPTVPTDLCMLDWQLSVIGSPCLDISYFIWICTDKKFRDQHYLKLIDLYYDTFSSFLFEFGGDPNKLYPRSVFEKHLKLFSIFGFFGALYNVASNLADFERVPNVFVEDSDKSLIRMFEEVANDSYYIRMYEIVEDFVKYGYSLSSDCI